MSAAGQTDWFHQNAPPTSGSGVSSSGDWFTDNAPPPAQGPLGKVVTFVGDTLSKTAHKMNVENTLAGIEDAGDHFQQTGDWGRLWSDIRDVLPAMHVGDPRGPAPQQIADIQDTYRKIKAGDYSGAAANITPYIMANTAPDGETVSNAAGVTGTAVKGAAKGAYQANKGGLQNPVHAAATCTAALVPVVGKPIAGAIEAINTGVGAVKGAASALAQRSTAKASEASIQANRANGNDPLWQQAGTTTTNPEPQQPVTFTPDELAQLKADLQAKIAARQKTAPPAAEASPPVATPAPEPDIRDGIAQGFGIKSYASATPDAKARIDSIAARLKPQPPSPTSVNISPQAVAAEEQRAVSAPTVQAPPASKQITPGVVVTKQSSPLTQAVIANEPQTPIPSPYREAFEGDKGGTLSPQETQNRQAVAVRFAPELLKRGIKPEDLDTEEGRAQALQVAESIPSLSKNKQLLSSLKNYDPSDTTLDATQTLMSQWARFAELTGLSGAKSLGDLAKGLSK